MSENEKHNEKMKRLKTSKQKIFAKKTVKKGLIIVHTGTGKGKSTAAFGMVFRGIAHGMPCAVVQFIKGAMATGERDLIKSTFMNFVNSILLEMDLLGIPKTKKKILHLQKKHGVKPRNLSLIRKKR